MRSFPRGTHTARHAGAAPASRGAHSAAPGAHGAQSADAAQGADALEGAHVAGRREKAAQSPTITSSFDDAGAAPAAQGAQPGAAAPAAHPAPARAYNPACGAAAAASDAARSASATDAASAASSAAAGTPGAATAGAAAPAAAAPTESEPVIFGGRSLLSLRLHMGRRERVDIVRQKKQRRSSFSLTRTVAAVALLVLCLVSTGSTMAYLTYTANAAANRTTAGAVYIEVVETTASGTKSFKSGSNTAVSGTDGKLVTISNPEGPDRTDEVVRVSLVPEVEALASDGTTKTGASQFMSETWGAPVQLSDGSWALKGEVLTVYLNRGWQDNWTYADGAFCYKKVLSPGQSTAQLMTGVEMADGQNAADYGTIKVNVFADAIQATPNSDTDPTVGAPGAWNCTVDANGNVTKVTS